MLDHSDPRRASQSDLQTIAREAKYLNKLPPHQLVRLNLAGVVKERGGLVCLSSAARFDKWNRAAVR